MEYKARISRNERRHKRLPWAGIIAILVIICLAVATIHRFRYRAPSEASRTHKTLQVAPSNFGLIADTLIVSCCRSFDLSDSVLIDATISQPSGPAYHRFQQGWPSELPFLLYAQRLNDEVKRRNFQCDCVESSKQGRLDCSITVAGTIGAHVLLQSSKATKLASREVAIVVDHLGAYSADDLMKLIKSGVVFSYFAMPDFYPSGEMARLFAKGNITSIIRFSKGDSRVKGRFDFRKPMVKDAMSRHPGARSFVFDEQALSDSQFTKPILTEARRAKLPYLYYHDAPQAIDRFVLSHGVQMVKLEIQADGDNLSPAGEFSDNYDIFGRSKVALFNKLLSPNSPRRMAVWIDASRTSPEWLISLKETLAGLGVKLRPYMKLARDVDGL
jgi:hypothetical protein